MLLPVLFVILFFSGVQSQAIDQIDMYRSAEHSIVRLSISDKPFRLQVDLSGHSFTGRDGVFLSKQFADPTPHELKFRYFKSDQKGLRPLVILLPPIIGQTVGDQIVAENLVANDIDVIIPVFGSVLETARSLYETDRTITSYLIAMRLLIKTIVNDPAQQIDAKKVGVFGMSLGGVLSSVLVGLSEDVTHSFILVGGGNLSEISQNSNQSIVMNFKKNMIAVGSATEENWQESIRKDFSFEPLDYAKYATGKKIFMVMCEKDDVIPYKNQLELWNALGKPPSASSTFHSHIGTIIKWIVKSNSDLISFMKN